MKGLPGFLAALALLTASAPALAQDNRFYASVSGLYVMPRAAAVELDVDVPGNPVTRHTVGSDLAMKNGFGFAAAAGYGADAGLRGELEIGHRSVDFEEFDGVRVSGPTINASFDGKFPYEGSVRLWTVMANGIFAAEIWRVRPYFGAGVGVAFAKVTEDAQSATVGVGNDAQTVSTDGGDANDTVMAYQAMLGVGYPLSDAVEVRLGYRYFATAEGEFDGFKASFGSHNIEAGIRFRF